MLKIKLTFLTTLLLAGLKLTAQELPSTHYHSSFDYDTYCNLYNKAYNADTNDRITFLIELCHYYFDNSNMSAVPDSLNPLINSIDYSQIQPKDSNYLNSLMLQFYRASKIQIPLQVLNLGSEILELNTPLTNKDSLLVYNNLFYLFDELQLYNQQLELLPTLSRLCEKLNFGQFHWYPYSIWEADIFYNLGYYEEAVSGWLACAEVAKDSNDLFMTAHFLNNVSLALEKLNQLDSAIRINEIAERTLYEHLDSTVHRHVNMLWIIRMNKADYISQLGRYKEALKIYREEASKNKTGQSFQSLFQNASNTTQCYINWGKPELAKKYLDQCELLTKNKQFVYADIKVLKLKVQYFESIAQFEKAHFHQKKLTHITDSINQFSNKRQTKALSALALFEKRKQELLQTSKLKAQAELKAAKETQKASELELQNKLFLIAALLFLMLLIFAYYAYRIKKKRHKEISIKSAELEASKQQISESLLEKEMLLKEVHHRVKNNLQIVSSILRLQSNRSDNPVIIKSLEDSQKRIQSMYLVHQKLYQTEQLSMLPIENYLTDLCNGIADGLISPTFKLDYAVYGNEIKFDSEIAIPLGFIVNELFTNSLKHAFKDRHSGKVTVNISQKDDYFKLSYHDNGPGMPEHADITNTNSLGLTLIQILTKQLFGKSEWKNDQGLLFTLTFKLAKHENRS